MKLCKECYEFLQPYIVAGAVVQYDPGSTCEVCGDEGLVLMGRMVEYIDINHLIHDAITTWRNIAERHH